MKNFLEFGLLATRTVHVLYTFMFVNSLHFIAFIKWEVKQMKAFGERTLYLRGYETCSNDLRRLTFYVAIGVVPGLNRHVNYSIYYVVHIVYTVHTYVNPI